VNDASGVSSIKRISNFDCQWQQSLRFQWPPPNPVLQRQPVQKLHRDEGVPVLLTDVVDGADVRMIESRRGLRLTLETGECLRATSGGKNFNATKRCRRVSSALYTTPMPPPPSFSMIR
jgi:hypothetical protein